MDLTIEQGATFSATTTVRRFPSDPSPLDLTGAVAKAQIRPEPCGTLICELSTANGRIVLGGSSGELRFELDAATTAKLPAGTFRFDVKLTLPDGFVLRAVEGRAVVRPEVSGPKCR